jgi:hypothetical protein
MPKAKSNIFDTLKPAAIAAIAPSTIFTVLDADDVQHAQTVFAGLKTADSAAHSLAMSLYHKGVSVDALTIPSERKPNPQFNKALWVEIVQAIIRAPQFGELGQKSIARKLAGLDPENSDDSTRRTLEMRKVNQCLKMIRKALSAAHETEGRDTRKPLTLHEQLDQWAKSALDAITAKRDKAGLTQEQGDTLLAAWRDVRAQSNAVFKTK